MKRTLVFLACSFIMMPSTVNGYRQITHEDLSEAAVEASVLNRDGIVLENIGLEQLGEEQTFSIDGFNEKTIIQHVRDGSRIEDGGSRALSHFFDPFFDRGLFGQNPRSPDWALEDRQDFDDQFASFKDGREHFYHALTSSTKEERERRFGLTFEKLGQVIHHLQDMAQPQHTRSDQHLDFPFIKIPGLENPSRYEAHTALVQGTPAFTGLLSEGLYPNVRFSSARRFWHTRDKNPITGQGIAEFTNTNFLSAGTNFDTIRYPFPRFEDATPRDDNANQLLQSAGVTPPPECLPPNRHCLMTFFRAPVSDNYRPAASGINDRASTLSIFDQDLKAFNRSYSFTDPDTGEVHTTHDVFSLNRFNFDEAHKFLIPRAVAYSAGLIDYSRQGDVTTTRSLS